MEKVKIKSAMNVYAISTITLWFLIVVASAIILALNGIRVPANELLGLSGLVAVLFGIPPTLVYIKY